MRACLICGEPIPADRKSNNTKYCSINCARKAEARQRMEYIKSRSARAGKVAQSVYRAYNRSCAICNWQATEELISVNGKIQYSHGNEIHHIIPASEGGRDTADNLILLCPNHHKQADLGLIPRSTLQAYTRPLDLSADAIATIKSECADTITALIFDTAENG